MKELHNPNFPRKPTVLVPQSRALLQRASVATPANAESFSNVQASDAAHASPGSIELHWAQHQEEVRAAQRLRHQVFVTELGAHLATPIPGHDIDLFDDYCEHLLVRRTGTREVIGTCRVLTPVKVQRVGSSCGDVEFDLTRLRSLRGRMLELGRACVHPHHEHGGVIMALWRGLVEFMLRNRLDTMMGCASLPMLHNGVVSGDVAASVWRQVREEHLAPITDHVLPRLALPVERLDDALDMAPPALIRGSLRMGAKVLGPPAWNPDFNTADLPLLLRVADMPPRYRGHFGAERSR